MKQLPITGTSKMQLKKAIRLYWQLSSFLLFKVITLGACFIQLFWIIGKSKSQPLPTCWAICGKIYYYHVQCMACIATSGANCLTTGYSSVCLVASAWAHYAKCHQNHLSSARHQTSVPLEDLYYVYTKFILFHSTQNRSNATANSLSGHQISTIVFVIMEIVHTIRRGLLVLTKTQDMLGSLLLSGTHILINTA